MMFYEHYQAQSRSDCNRPVESFSYSYHSSPSGPSQSASSLDSVGILKPSTESSITPLPRAYVQSYHPQQSFSEDAAFFSSQEALLSHPEGPSRDPVVSFQTLEKADGDGVQVPSASYYAGKNEHFPDIERNAYCEPDMEYKDFNRKTRIIWSSRIKLKAYVITLPPSPFLPPLPLGPFLPSSPTPLPSPTGGIIIITGDGGVI